MAASVASRTASTASLDQQHAAALARLKDRLAARAAIDDSHAQLVDIFTDDFTEGWV